MGFVLYLKGKDHQKKFNIKNSSTKPEFYCETCNIAANTREVLDKHLKSSTHAETVKK